MLTNILDGCLERTHNKTTCALLLQLLNEEVHSNGLLQYFHALLDGGEEAVFLLLEDVGDALLAGLEFGVGLAHLG
ncbi:hypothetical protein, partial [uncultured Zoogloea sp.]|uniref:hypothetical protein n=1 Tax=uncultured Zoogloea sp. TaxID=160237 RepID=UPI0026288366